MSSLLSFLFSSPEIQTLSVMQLSLRDLYLEPDTHQPYVLMNAEMNSVFSSGENEDTSQIIMKRLGSEIEVLPSREHRLQWEHKRASVQS